MSKNKKLKNDIKILRKTISLIHRLDSLYFFLIIVRSLLLTAKYFVTLIMSARIIDELIGAQSIEALVIYVSIIVGANFVLKLLSDLATRIINAKDSTLRQKVQCTISEKITKLDYEYMDSPILHNLRQRILEYDNMSGTTYEITRSISDVITAVVEICVSVSVSIALFTTNLNVVDSAFAAVINSPYAAVVIAVAMCLVIVMHVHNAKKQGECQMEINTNAMKINRIGIYIQEHLVGDYKNGKDLRMYDTKELMDDVQNEFVYGFKKTAALFFNKIFMVQKNGTIADGIFTGIIYLFVVMKAYIGAISIGSVMKYVGMIQRLSKGLSSLLSGITMIRVGCQFLDNIHQLLELPDKKYHGTLPVEKREDNEYDIQFKNVSFKYPGTEEYVLKDISLELTIGERLAVVGMNGAGKTTFIKLLSRLYDPTEGEILLNGIDIKKYDYDEYMSLFSVVFQDFKMFAFEVSQNISASKCVDENKVLDSIEKSGLNERISRLDKGIHTYVYKNFDDNGVDFSGGELQKMAIARALYKDAPIVILDEPTASLDPISEFEIYSKFDSLVGNKTAIYISHRLSSCRFCHDIAVFHEGKIIQRGSHEELVDTNGKYKELWKAQAQYYT